MYWMELMSTREVYIGLIPDYKRMGYACFTDEKITLCQYSRYLIFAVLPVVDNQRFCKVYSCSRPLVEARSDGYGDLGAKALLSVLVEVTS